MAKNPRKRKTKRERSKEACMNSGPGFVPLRSPLEGFTKDEAREIWGKAGQFHETQFEAEMGRLEEIAQTANAFYLLTILAATNLYPGVSDTGGLSESWHTPPVSQPEIELFQALALRNIATGQDKAIPLDVALQDVQELLHRVSRSFVLKRLAGIDTACDEETKSILMLQEQLRLHTQFVRNWGYYRQSLEILKKLYGPVDEAFQRKGLLAVSDLISAFEFLNERAAIAVTEHIKRFASVWAEEALDKAVYAYTKAFELLQTGDDFLSYCKDSEVDLDEAKCILLMHSFQYLHAMFTVTVADLSSRLGSDPQAVRRTLEMLSLTSGELHAYDAERFLLENPVWTRPLVRLDNDEFFCPLPQLFTGFAFAILDRLSCDDKEIRRAVTERRARFLENQVAKLFRDAFPESQILKDVKWKDHDTQYETDLVVVIDSYLIIVEAKSGAVSWPALRGAPDRARKHIQELLIGPSIQSRRLERKIELLKDESHKPDSFLENLPVDFTSIWQIVRLSVTLEDFATIQSNMMRLARTGWMPSDFDPAPTFSVADLQTVLTILPSVSERLYYLVRRSELERKVRYDADELDLLGYYLKSGFCTGSFGQGNEMLALRGKSLDVDEYMVATDAGSTPVKPKREFTQWWLDILDHVESSRPTRWSEALVMLLSVELKAQRGIEKRTKKLRAVVRSSASKATAEDSIILAPDYLRADAFAVVVLRDMPRDERRQRMADVAQDAFDRCEANRCLVLAMDVACRKYPYQTLAVFEKQPLTDSFS